MKYKFLGGIALTAGLATFMFAAAPAATAADFVFSFDTNDVAFAYSDGYWDHHHHWHKWHNTREAREYRKRYHDHYIAAKHTSRRNKGWRDEDHDHIPNAVDHDRDNDGRPNRVDSHPDNPYRK
jgi:hypothetical protein